MNQSGSSVPKLLAESLIAYKRLLSYEPRFQENALKVFKDKSNEWYMTPEFRKMQETVATINAIEANYRTLWSNIKTQLSFICVLQQCRMKSITNTTKSRRSSTNTVMF